MLQESPNVVTKNSETGNVVRLQRDIQSKDGQRSASLALNCTLKSRSSDAFKFNRLINRLFQFQRNIHTSNRTQLSCTHAMSTVD